MKWVRVCNFARLDRQMQEKHDRSERIFEVRPAQCLQLHLETCKTRRVPHPMFIPLSTLCHSVLFLTLSKASFSSRNILLLRVSKHCVTAHDKSCTSGYFADHLSETFHTQPKKLRLLYVIFR